MVDFFSQFRSVIERILRDFWESLKKAIFYPDKCQFPDNQFRLISYAKYGRKLRTV